MYENDWKVTKTCLESLEIEKGTTWVKF